MNNSKIPTPRQRRILLKSFTAFTAVEKVIDMLQKIANNNCQITILGQLSPKINPEENRIPSEDELKTKFKNLLDSPLDFGIISNPEIGKIVVGGAFAAMFLQSINGKNVGSMAQGLYSVLLGLGIDQERATTFLNTIINGGYLLIIRGYDTKINQLEQQLNL